MDHSRHTLLLLLCVVIVGVTALQDPRVTNPHYLSFEPQITPRHHVFDYDRKEIVDTLWSGDSKDVAVKRLKAICGENTEWTVSSTYTTKHNGVQHVYLLQLHNGLPISNSPANVNVDRYGNVINVGETCYKEGRGKTAATPSVSPMGALYAIATHLGLADKMNKGTMAVLPIAATTKAVYGKITSPSTSFTIKGHHLSLSEDEEIPIQLSLLQNEAGGLNLTWNLVLKLKNNWFDVHVDAHSGEVLSLIDWVQWETYEAYAIPNESPLLGDRQVKTNPADSTASPMGWLNQGFGAATVFTTSVGNNVYAQLNPTGDIGWVYNYRPDGNVDRTFKFPIDFFAQPYEYRDAALTNLFFWNNVIHDLFYLRGFNEEAGNFQENNFDKGGLENDAVQANAQDGSGFNNANFATPPDGYRPRMRMYLWNQVSPMLDGDLDSGIIIHEYGHGISTRLTGGPNNSNCLINGQSGGMGEGWGDFWATILEMKPEYRPDDAFPMGQYAAGRGIRPFPYSADFSIDPQTYGWINKPGYDQTLNVHAKGSVWCTILIEVYWELVTKHGFDPDWYYGTGGNNVLLQNVVDGLKLQPCKPNFVDARNAILLADKQNNGGRYVCDMWAAFARRGLGYSAIGTTQPVQESFDLPPSCQ